MCCQFKIGSFSTTALSQPAERMHCFTRGGCALCLQVQIRPWNLSDSDFVMDGSQPLDPRKTIFVGGVPRPLRAGNYLPPPPPPQTRLSHPNCDFLKYTGFVGSCSAFYHIVSAICNDLKMWLAGLVSKEIDLLK